ncbi:MAG: sugar transferase [Actinomycetota bacterium]
MQSQGERPQIRRRGKEWRERLTALVLLVPASPLLLLSAAAIKLESVLRPAARGPIFFREARVARGEVIGLLKFRTLSASALADLGPGPTHIARYEKAGEITIVGRFIRQWYLDELPQLLNIVRGDMLLIGTRPYPLELYEKELAQGITRKRDMPAGLIGPVQAHKGDERASDGGVGLDAAYWEAFQKLSGWRLLLLDLKIVARSLKVQLQHKGL